jgi:hypothetical protein
MPERSVFQSRDGPGTFAALGTDFTIRMEDTATLTLQLANKGPWRVQLNGEPTRHVSTGPGDLRVETAVTTTWEGDRLMIRMQGTENRQGKTFPFTKQYRFTANPDHTITVESPDGDTDVWLASTYRWLEAM